MTLDSMDPKAKLESLCVVVPLFNEEICLEQFISLIQPHLALLCERITVHLLLVNNGSTDNSLEILRDWDWGKTNVGVLTLTRNFPYEVAIMAGLASVNADIYAVLDADGEDPPELLGTFLDSIVKDSNYAAVGLRQKRNESKSISFFRQGGYRILSRISDDPFRINVGNFSMFRKVVRDFIVTNNNSYPFMRALMSRSGFRTALISHDRNPRIGGISKFSRIALFKFGIAGFLTTTTWPLRAVAYVSIPTLSIGLLFLLSEVFFTLNLTKLYLIFITVVLCILQLSITSISLYLARVYKNGLNQPLYFIDWKRSYKANKFMFEISE
jgi:glycosyltransferase involved in cell wall biosynthesis